jgi:hypothetical protein
MAEQTVAAVAVGNRYNRASHFLRYLADQLSILRKKHMEDYKSEPLAATRTLSTLAQFADDNF